MQGNGGKTVLMLAAQNGNFDNKHHDNHHDNQEKKRKLH
jgi:hypothetical protein